MSRSVSVTVTYTPDDALRVTTWIKNQSYFYRNAAWIVSVTVFCVFIAMILFLTNDLGQLNLLGAIVFSSIPAALIGVVVFLLHMSLNPRLMRRAIAKYYRSSPISNEETETVFSDERIRIKSSLGSSEIEWPAIVKCVETDSDILFYLGTLPSWFIPKQALASVGELAMLREILSDSLKGKTTLKWDRSFH